MKLLKYLKNFIRKQRENGTGHCPNCGTCWVYLKDKRPEARKGVISGHPIRSRSIFFRGTTGINICNDCLDNPERLDTEKIFSDLIKSGWDSHNADLAKKAIEEQFYEYVQNNIRFNRLEDILNNEVNLFLLGKLV